MVTGTNGENMIRAEGATCAEAWRRALDQATAVGMLPGGGGGLRPDPPPRGVRCRESTGCVASRRRGGARGDPRTEARARRSGSSPPRLGAHQELEDRSLRRPLLACSYALNKRGSTIDMALTVPQTP